MEPPLATLSPEEIERRCRLLTEIADRIVLLRAFWATTLSFEVAREAEAWLGKLQEIASTIPKEAAERALGQHVGFLTQPVQAISRAQIPERLQESLLAPSAPNTWNAETMSEIYFCMHGYNRPERSIALQASTGDIDGALTRYLQARLPEHVAAQLNYAFGIEDVFDQLADPQWKRVIEEAVWFCWQFGRPNYAPTRERKKFMQSYIAGRIPTARLLDQAWEACQQEEKDVMRSAILKQASGPDEASAPDLDNLSDEEIESLYHRTMRHVAAGTPQRV